MVTQEREVWFENILLFTSKSTDLLAFRHEGWAEDYG